MENHSIFKIFNEEELEQLINSLKQKFGDAEYISSKHQLTFPNHQSSIFLRLPYCFNYHPHQLTATNFLIVIIHSGEAALAYSEEDQIVEHKIVKAYMVRQKQGKSQIKHLKTKGKSKAGSRVRLAGADHFFEQINEKISEWKAYFEIDKIAISCNKTLQPFLFNRSDAALKKEDPRILKIPKHVQEANFQNLVLMHNYLISMELKFLDTDKQDIDKILSNFSNE